MELDSFLALDFTDGDDSSEASDSLFVVPLDDVFSEGSSWLGSSSVDISLALSISSSSITVHTVPSPFASSSPAATDEPLSPRDVAHDTDTSWIATPYQETCLYEFGSASRSAFQHSQCAAFAGESFDTPTSGQGPTTVTDAVQMRSPPPGTSKPSVPGMEYVPAASQHRPYPLVVVEGTDQSSPTSVDSGTAHNPTASTTTYSPWRATTSASWYHGQGRSIAPSGHYDMPVASPAPMPLSAPAWQTSFSFSSPPAPSAPQMCVSPLSMTPYATHDLYEPSVVPPMYHSQHMLPQQQPHPHPHQHPHLHPHQHPHQHHPHPHHPHPHQHQHQHQHHQHQDQHHYHHRSMSDPGNDVALYDISVGLRARGVAGGVAIVEPQAIAAPAPPPSPRRSTATAIPSLGQMNRSDARVPSATKRRTASGPSTFMTGGAAPAGSSRPPSGSAPTATSSGSGEGSGGGRFDMQFVNYTSKDANQILSGVAPSGSSKRKRKLEEESSKSDEARGSSSGRRSGEKRRVLSH
jgi:hypothetical protein